MDLSAIVASASAFLGPVRLVTSKDVVLPYREQNDATIRAFLQKLEVGEGGRIVYLSSYPRNYTRTETLLARLRHMGYEIEEQIYPHRPLRILREALRLRGSKDAVLLGFRSHELLLFVRLLLGRSVPLIFDAFVSTADTLCDDRQSVPKFFEPILRAYDRWLSRLANVTLVDTQTHAHFFRDVLRCRNVEVVYVECNEALFHPVDVQPQEPPLILWYGTGQPLHGVDRILQWAKSLEPLPLRFLLIGPIQKQHAVLLRSLALQHVEFVDHIPYELLPATIARATLCLGGPFGMTGKAQRVIPGKVYQMLACNRPALVGDTPAIAELFGHEL